MRWGAPSCGVFVLFASVLALACGACTRTCGGVPAPDAGSEGGTEGGSAWSAIRLIGRFERGAGARFAWSGSSFQVRFTGPSLAMRLRTSPLAPHPVQIDGKPVMLDEKTTAYSVRIDDRPPVVIEVSHDRERYELAAGLDPAVPHDAVVTREAEAFAGVHELVDVEVGPGGRLLAPPVRSLRIEVVGDSISCGYGVLGENDRCPFTYKTERASAAYGARLGRALDSDVTTVCWSGRGVLRNYDGSTTGTMPELWELTLPMAPQTRWSFSEAALPDMVITNLGTNDFLGGAGRPLDVPAFEDAYVKFLKRVRDVYPAAWIFVTTSAMMKTVPASFGRVVARRTSEGDARIELVLLPSEAPHWGCDGHPDVEMNERIAAALETRIRARVRR